MAGFFKILLGGAVGAILGILFVKKQGGPSLFERSALPPAPARPVETPVASSATTVTPAPEPTPPAPVVPTYLVPVYYAPQAVAPAAAPAPVVAPQAPPLAPVPTPVVEPPATPEVAQVAPEPQPPAFQAVPVPVVVTPEPSEEPPIEVAAPVVEELAPVVEAAAPMVEEPATLVEQTVPVFLAPEPPPAVAEEPVPGEPPEVPLVAVAPDVALESEVDEILAATVGPAGESGSEVVFSPEVLEEPVPGAGWEPSAVFLHEDAELEELLPVVPDDVKLYEGVEIDQKTSIDEDTWLTAGWPEIAEAAAAESAASIDEELFELEPPGPAEPTPTPADETSLEPTAVEPFPALEEPITTQAETPTEPIVEAPRQDDLTARIEETRRRIAEAAAARAAAPAFEEVWDAEPRVAPEAAPADEPPVMEPPVMEVPVLEVPTEPAVAEQPAPEPVAAAIPEAVVEPVAEPVVQPAAVDVPVAEDVSSDDLKSRIEETRRRIREELEKPFAVVDEPAAPEPARSAAAAAAVPSNGGAPVQPAAAATAEAPTIEAPTSGESDFDAMRARIELTRSRLKAKAFDAMMAGESALLGRDEQVPGDASKPAVSIDSEIERTVDNTLREEDR